MIKKIFYKTECFGKDERKMTIYKLRTMHHNAEDRSKEVLNNGFDEYGKIKNDPRVTPLGKVLRKYWIDELPQLYNLVRGEMSIVGIRPLRKSSCEYLLLKKETKKRVFKYNPGLFGIQYSNKNGTIDNYIKNLEGYLDEKENGSIKTDVKYLCKILINIFLRGVRSN